MWAAQVIEAVYQIHNRGIVIGILWNLAEHVGHDGKHLCGIAGCNTRPYYSCTAAHKNPVSLPFSDCTDPFLREIIEKCHMADPDDNGPGL